MNHEDLLIALTRTGAFATMEDAQRATLTTFETLGYALPAALLRELSVTLPRSYVSCLWLGPSAAEAARRLAHALPAWNAADIPPPLLEELHIVCSALAALLPSELVRRITSALPLPLMHLFTGPALPASKAAVQTLVAHVSQHQDRASD